jgi:hypothetical protein
MVEPFKPQPIGLQVPDLIIEEECSDYMKEMYRRAAAGKAFLEGEHCRKISIVLTALHLHLSCIFMLVCFTHAMIEE